MDKPAPCPQTGKRTTIHGEGTHRGHWHDRPLSVTFTARSTKWRGARTSRPPRSLLAPSLRQLLDGIASTAGYARSPLTNHKEIFEDVVIFAGRKWLATNQTADCHIHRCLNFDLDDVVTGGTVGALKQRRLEHSDTRGGRRLDQR